MRRLVRGHPYLGHGANLVGKRWPYVMAHMNNSMIRLEVGKELSARLDRVRVNGLGEQVSKLLPPSAVLLRDL